MKVSINQKRTLVLISVFASFLIITSLPGYLLRNHPNVREACVEKCKAIGKEGLLVYSGPATPKQTYKDANSTCECR
jgi:hypothetical protein